MSTIDTSVFNQPNLQLRIWFSNTGTGFVPLDPPQLLTPAPYSSHALTAFNASNILGQVPAGQVTGPIANNQLANSTITVNSGTGLSGGGSIALGGSTTFNNTGVVSITSSNGINVSGNNGAVTVSTTASSNNIPNTIVMRDGGCNLSASNAVLGGVLTLSDAASQIRIANETLIQTPGTGNFFGGQSAGRALTSGAYNTGVGRSALYNNTTGYQNTSCGEESMFNNITGGNNTAFGFASLNSLTNGTRNTAVGSGALSLQKTSDGNTALGYEAGFDLTTGSYNVLVGSSAGYELSSGSQNVIVGYNTVGISPTTGNNNIIIGANAGTSINTGSGNIDIGNTGFGDESNVIRIGTSQTKAVMVGVYGVTIASGGTPVYVNGSGLLGTATSSARFKTNIQDMASTSDDILKLRPVTFNYKQDIDPDAAPQFGLIAEEVQKINPNLIVCDPQGRPYSVRYEAVNAMLLNEFLKEHHKVEQLEHDLSEMKDALTKISARLK
jgi:hypothetical protein